MPRSAAFGYAFKREIYTIPFTGFLSVATQINRLLSLGILFGFDLVGIAIVPTVIGTGAAATRVINVRKGNATGTIVGTVTATLANQGTLGVVTVGTVTTAGRANLFSDQGAAPDTLTIELPTGGTAFTAGGLDLILTYRTITQKAA